MLLIYSSHIGSRLQYIITTLFGSNATVCTSKEKFLEHIGERINYSAERISDKELWICPNGLLYATGICEQVTECFEWEGRKVFFKTRGDIPFDILSASFYLLSRYEEYLPHSVDVYGRYDHSESIAFREDFLHIPLVNQWMQLFNGILQERFPGYLLPASRFSFIPTYDIDIAYSYVYQPLVKNVFGFYRDLLLGKFEAVAERAGVYSGRKKDPFDVYDWLDELHNRYALQPVYFFLLAEKQKEKDKNNNPRSTGMTVLVKKHAAKYLTGIHPSWQSGDDDGKLKNEIAILEKATQKKVLDSRQHYIRMKLPGTYRKLIEEGIMHDHSMGYATSNGFRASYTLPFYWYDLEKETTTGLLIHPFCFMDTNASFQQRETEDEAFLELKEYYETVKAVNGQLVTIFHNHFLTEQPEWEGWRKMYTRFLEYAFSLRLCVKKTPATDINV